MTGQNECIVSKQLPPLHYCIILGSTQEPAVGDIMVRNRDGAVTVYYTDGMRRPQWTPICTSDAGYSVLTVICKQLGYKKAKSVAVPPLGPGISK